MFKKIVSMLFASMFLVSLFAITACNTIHGAGQDIEKGGEKIKNEADEHK